MTLCNHGLYDIAKDFQPALAALIALGAACIAWYVGMAKVNHDRKVAAFQRVSSQLGVCLRLKLRAERLSDIARGLGAWLQLETPDPAKLYEVLQAWPDAPEMDDAWKVIEGFPRDAMILFETLQNSHWEIAAYKRETRAEWLDENRPSVVATACSDLSASHSKLRVILEKEIETLERERERLHRSL